SVENTVPDVIITLDDVPGDIVPVYISSSEDDVDENDVDDAVLVLAGGDKGMEAEVAFEQQVDIAGDDSDDSDTRTSPLSAVTWWRPPQQLPELPWLLHGHPAEPPGLHPSPFGAFAACRPEDPAASALLATSPRASCWHEEHLPAGVRRDSCVACPSLSVPGRAQCPGTHLDHRSERLTVSPQEVSPRCSPTELCRARHPPAAPDRNGRPSLLPLVSTAPPRPGSPATCPASGTGAMQSPPLFPPTTLIVGDSIARGIRFFNAITRSFPGATVADITAKLPGLLQSLPPSIHRIIVHVSTNETAHQQSELTKSDFRTLLHILQCSGKSVFISGPLPMLIRSTDRFSCLLSLSSWLRSLCSTFSTHSIHICSGTYCHFSPMMDFT
ncbi:hypothetical protein GBF38_007428, partial [Xyrichtys novacula]